MDKKKKAIFGLLIESGRWCVPPGLVMDWKDPWMITGEDLVQSSTTPMTETEFGKKLQETARQKIRRLQSVFSPRYRHHRPNRGQELIVRIQSLFELFSKEATNRTFRYLIGQNIEVIAALQAVCEEEHQKLKKFMSDTIQMDVDLESEAARAIIRAMAKEAGLTHDTWECWAEALDLEMKISQLALQRLQPAAQACYLVELEAKRPLTWVEDMVMNALFEENRCWRGEIARLALKVNEITGNRNFLQRHRYELWDIVDESVLNDYE